MSDQIAHYADSVLALHRTKDEDGGRRTLLLCPRRVRCKGVALEWRWLWWSCPHCGQDWSDYDRRLRRRPPIALRTFKVAFVAGAVERIEDRLRMQRYAEMVQVVASRSLMLATDVQNDNSRVGSTSSGLNPNVNSVSSGRCFWLAGDEQGGQPEQSGCITGSAPTAEWMTLPKRANLEDNKVRW